MNKLFLKNFLVLIGMLFVFFAFMLYNIYYGSEDLDRSDDLVLETYQVIAEVKEMSELFSAMLASQRGYLLTGDTVFLSQYQTEKKKTADLINKMSEKFKESSSQQNRLNTIRDYLIQFTSTLEQHSQNIEFDDRNTRILEDIDYIREIKSDLAHVNNALLDEQYDILDRSIDSLETQRNQYLDTLTISIIVSTLLIVIIHGSLLYTQRGRSLAESELEETKKRLELAIEGTQDGIFDWDLGTDKVFYSRAFFLMLGYNDKGGDYGTIDDLKDLLHPDEKEKVLDHISQYLDGDLSEYMQEFRMRHKSGRWVWVQSRAQALFDNKGQAYRMIGAHSDITHIIKSREKLQDEKEQAIEANRAKSDFLAHMSHEIRTPLTAISGIAEILERNKDNLDDKQQKLVATLTSSSTSLKELVNDVLDFSKIESGEVEIEHKEFVAEDLFEPIVSMMNLKAIEKGISFYIDYSALGKQKIVGDIKRVRQILINLIGNAVKFTEKGGVTVVATVKNDHEKHALCVDVKDTGIGIKEQDLNIIFERFKQADSTVARRFGGTGLGLPISKKLAQLMQGDITVKSIRDEGSTFSLVIPYIAGEDENEDETDKSTLQKITDKITTEINDKVKALIVEDYEGNVVVIGYILDELGISYDIASNGQEAIDLWQNNYYNFVLMDVQMPIMDGFSATKKIRSIEKEKGLEAIPIIGMTAHALVGDKEECVKAGMDSYIPKPIVEADLKKEIYKFLKSETRHAASV